MNERHPNFTDNIEMPLSKGPVLDRGNSTDGVKIQRKKTDRLSNEHRDEEFLDGELKHIEKLMNETFQERDSEKIATIAKSLLSYLPYFSACKNSPQKNLFFVLKNKFDVWLSQFMETQGSSNQSESLDNELDQSVILRELCFATDKRIAVPAKQQLKIFFQEELKKLFDKTSLKDQSNSANEIHHAQIESMGLCLEALSYRSDKRELKSIAEVINSLLGKTEEHKVRNFNFFCMMYGPRLSVANFHSTRVLGRAIMKPYIENFRLPSKLTLRAWFGNFSKSRRGNKGFLNPEINSNLEHVLRNNMISLSQLETDRGLLGKNAVEDLYKKFGILNFGRLSKDFYKEQYLEQNNKDSPYILVISATEDNNASSYNKVSRQAYEDLRLAAKGGLPVRVIEVENKLQLARRINFLKKQYKLPPKVVIFSAHASEKEITLGEAKYGPKHYKNFFGNKDLAAEKTERLQPYLDFFGKDTILVLDGCHKNSSRSFVKKIADITGCTVVFPDGITSATSFVSNNKGNDRFILSVKYAHGAKPVVYKNKLK